MGHPLSPHSGAATGQHGTPTAERNEQHAIPIAGWLPDLRLKPLDPDQGAKASEVAHIVGQ